MSLSWDVSAMHTLMTVVRQKLQHKCAWDLADGPVGMCLQSKACREFS